MWKNGEKPFGDSASEEEVIKGIATGHFDVPDTTPLEVKDIMKGIWSVTVISLEYFASGV